MKSTQGRRLLTSVETLESRRLLTSAINAGVLTVTGRTNADTFAISGSGTAVAVVENGGTARPFSGVTKILVYGGAGNDRVTVAATIAVPCELRGESGNDTLTGGAGNDLLDGGTGSDSLSGGAGNDSYWFGTPTASESNTISEAASAGFDTLNFSAIPWAATIDLANDAAIASIANGGITLGVRSAVGGVAANIENVYGGSGNDRIQGNATTNKLYGGGGSDTLVGGDGGDALSGGSGNDRIDGGFGNDTLLGEDGSDRLDGGYDADRLDGGNDADTLLATDGADTFYGGSGGDYLEARGYGSNSLYGGGGNDTLIGGLGADLLDGEAGSDSLAGGRGEDRYHFTAPVENETDTINETPGDSDSFDFRDSIVGVIVNLASDSSTATMTWAGTRTVKMAAAGQAANIEIVYGTSSDDQIWMNWRGDYAFGYAGNDYIVGGAGPDYVEAGDGVDTVWAGDGSDIIWGGTGNDMLFGEGGSDLFHGGDGDDHIEGAAGADVLYGDAGNDALYGDADSDTLYGGTGDDQMNGGDSYDVLISIGGGQRDVLVGAGGYDSFWADAESSELVYAEAGETANGYVHRIGSFVNGASRELDGQNLPDPTPVGTGVVWSARGSATLPLFGPNGITVEDVKQGAVGDCYFMSALVAACQVARQIYIEQAVVSLGDGTYAVRFGGQYVRVDDQLPNTPQFYSNPRAATDGSMWVAIMEKAYTFFRMGAGTYKSIEGGDPAVAMGHLGMSSASAAFGSSPTAMADRIATLWNAGQRAVVLSTVGEVPTSPKLIGSHGYNVIGVTKNADGSVRSITLRNPWGRDGAKFDYDSNPNDGLVTLSVAELARGNFDGIFWANA